jgi:hypothetical protein
MLRAASPVPTLPSRKVESRASIVASSAGYWTTMRVAPVTVGIGSAATEAAPVTDDLGAQAVARSMAPSGTRQRQVIGARYLCNYSYAIVPR